MPARHGGGVRPLAAVAVLAFLALSRPLAQEGGAVRECRVVGSDFAFSPATLEVRQNDVVRVLFRAEDIPHTFTIDEYRIAKRAAAGQTVQIEFRADRPGRFAIYCSLTADRRCQRMKGELVVRP